MQCELARLAPHFRARSGPHCRSLDPFSTYYREPCPANCVQLVVGPPCSSLLDVSVFTSLVAASPQATYIHRGRTQSRPGQAKGVPRGQARKEDDASDFSRERGRTKKKKGSPSKAIRRCKGRQTLTRERYLGSRSDPIIRPYLPPLTHSPVRPPSPACQPLAVWGIYSWEEAVVTRPLWRRSLCETLDLQSQDPFLLCDSILPRPIRSRP